MRVWYLCGNVALKRHFYDMRKKYDPMGTCQVHDGSKQTIKNIFINLIRQKGPCVCARCLVLDHVLP